jgi:hypothetical protein
MNRQRLTAIGEMIGMALIVGGIGSFSIPLSAIVAGVILVLIGAVGR